METNKKHMKNKRAPRKTVSFKMVHMAIILLIVTAFVTMAMKPAPSVEENIVGSWTFDFSKGGGTIQLKKVNKLKRDASGITFKADGTLIKRQNEGWCGTPPISYKNFPGTWKKTAENTLVLKYRYWGGKINSTWKITEVSENTITYNELKSETIRNKNR